MMNDITLEELKKVNYAMLERKNMVDEFYMITISAAFMYDDELVEILKKYRLQCKKPAFRELLDNFLECVE